MVTRAPAVSRWYAAACLGMFGLLGAGGVAASLVEEGLVAVPWRLLTASCALFLVMLVVSLLWPRRELPPSDSSGTVVVRAPVILVVSMAGAYLLVLAAAGAWVVLMLTDFSRVDPAGPVVVVVLGGIGSLPYLVRLVTGQLHRWEVTMSTDGLTYQGWMRRVSEPWSAVRGASVCRGKNAGVTVDLKATRPDLVIPATAFLVHPQAMADEITARAR